MPVTVEFRRFATARDGVFTRAEALRNGVTERQFRTGVAHGEWVRYRGVWIMAAVAPSRRTVMRAALLRLGPDARLTGETALSVYGLEMTPGLVAVSVPTGTSRRLPGAVILRDLDRGGSVRRLNGIPMMPRDRAVVDALRLGSRERGRVVLDEALRRGWITPTELAAWCDRLRGHRGMPNLRARLVDATSGARAESERVLARLFSGARLHGWIFNAEIRGPDGALIGIGDCVNVDLKLVVEVDGWAWHSTHERFQRDRDRQNALTNEGWMVLRFTWFDLTERPRLVLDQTRLAMQRCTKAIPPHVGGFRSPGVNNPPT